MTENAQNEATRFQSGTGWLVLLLILFLFFSLVAVRNKSLTADEEKHYRYGSNILDLNSDRIELDDSKMPITALNALWGKLGSLVPPGELRSFLKRIETGRFSTILFCLVVAHFVYQWSRELYGLLPAFAALILFIFDPNVIAHSHLVTTDLYLTGLVLITTYAFWRFCRDRSWKHATIAAVLLGMCQLTKYTGIFLYPLYLILVLAQDTPRFIAYLKDRDLRGFSNYILKGLKFSVFFILVSLLVINLGFLFNQTMKPFGDYDFMSQFFQAIQTDFTIFQRFPVPMPEPYLQGLDRVQFRDDTGFGVSRIYLLGDLKQGEGFTGYYFITYFLKTPLASQLLLLLALIAYLIKRKEYKFLTNEIFLLGPIIFFVVYLNFFFNTQIGVRYFLVVYPFLFVFSSSLLKGWFQFSSGQKAAIIALATYLIISLFSYFPHYIPYFNEIVWDRKQAYRYLADSNLDWGQSYWYLEEFLQEHPDAVYSPGCAVAETVVVSPNDLLGITSDPEEYRWLRENHEPDDTLAYTYLIYELGDERYDEIRLELSVDDSSLGAGECTSVRWEVDCVREFYFDGVKQQPHDQVAVLTVCPAATTTYELKGLGEDNRWYSEYITVEVGEP